MRVRLLRLPTLVFALLMLDAAFDAPRPAEAAGTCNPTDCLSNSAVNNRVQPTTVSTDDKGDVTFFASQSGQLPNVVLVLDNSTSMFELPYDTASFPNTAWVNAGPGTPANGRTPNGCGNVNTATTDNCTGIPFSQTAASCGNNTFFKGLKDASGNLYDKSKTYSPPDPWYDGTHGTGRFFDSTDVYSFFEWADPVNVAAGVPGGTTDVGFGIMFSTGNNLKGSTVNAYCADPVLSSVAGSGGKGGNGANAWSMTQQQRCQQCIDEVGYYIAPAATANDDNTGYILFKGNWLNFYPPKYLIARKALTDFISRQSTTPTPVRLGVVAYDPANVNSADVPATSVGMAARHDGGAFISNGMIPDCSITTWTGSATQTQQTGLISAVRGISFGDASHAVATPLAETVFNVGQFLTGDNKLYQTAFTGTSSDIWLKPGFTAPTGANKPLCVACQLSAIVLITDGVPFGDNNLPQRFRDNTIQCSRTPSTDPDPCGVDQNNGTPNLLDDVTNFLATTDLSPDATGGLPGVQNAITYVIGMGLKVPLLDNAARYGKTNAAVRVNTGQDLQEQLATAVVNIASRSTAFSSSAVQTLEVGTGATAFIPRFQPGSPADPIWEGHLSRFDVYNEFVAGNDLNGDGRTDGVFLVDKDLDIIAEDDKGVFRKVKNSQPAVPIWDAGAQLAATAAASRNIYTAVWDTANSVWKTIALPTWNGSGTPPADFTSVGNALGIDGTTACTTIQAAMATPIPSAYLSSGGVFDRDHCIKAILDYVRGYNIRNEVAGTTSVTVNRATMLGDIFHSAPVVVDPPVDQFFCDLGLHPQCVSTLYQYDTTRLIARLPNPTPSDSYTVTGGTISAYEKYWRDHESRKRVVLVGANDGMIHAFDAGLPTTSPPTLNPNGFRQVVYNAGTGNEVWAFIPPDQLPRLWLMLRGHQTYVDGEIMVRDVWVDGVQNDKGAAGFVNHPLIKQDVEYHTVAVASERQGGNHFFALDITDTNTPQMLWVYPPPCSDEEAMWGQTWGQFSPKPPPIGPVLLQTTNTAGPANYTADHTEERYAVFLNGGHSPYLNRGRIFSLLDVYTGTPLFTASYNPAAATGDPSGAMRFGFPAAGALIDYGVQNQYEPDGFFDTAVFGDEGGQIWTLRMNAPGHINTSGNNLVDNWSFGRAYEPNKDSPDDPRYRQPIYGLASTTIQEDNGWLRAYVGSGDRAHVRSQNGGDCRPDDPMTCIAAGCSVNTSLTMDSATRRYSSTFASASGSSASSPAIVSPTQALSTLSGPTCQSASVTENVQVSSCPASGMNFTESTLNFSCSGSPLSCTEGGFPQPTPNVNRNYTAVPPVAPNTFVSVAVLASGGLTRSLAGPSDASTYDQNRLNLSQLVDVTSTTANANGVITSAMAPAAGRGSAGWTIRYGTIDEKTAGGAAVLAGCVLWNTLLPSGGATGCASTGANVSALYQADVVTGAPTCASSFISGASYARTITRNVLTPPAEPAASIAVGAGGSSVQLSLLRVAPPGGIGVGGSGAEPTTIQSDVELLQMIHSLPLTVDQHMCRHVDPTTCK